MAAVKAALPAFFKAKLEYGFSGTKMRGCEYGIAAAVRHPGGFLGYARDQVSFCLRASGL